MKRMIWNTVITTGLLGAALLIVNVEGAAGKGQPEDVACCRMRANDLLEKCLDPLQLPNLTTGGCHTVAAETFRYCRRNPSRFECPTP